jgi:hypothetical protein
MEEFAKLALKKYRKNVILYWKENTINSND